VRKSQGNILLLLVNETPKKWYMVAVAVVVTAVVGACNNARGDEREFLSLYFIISYGGGGFPALG
jgi:hypothetical protein